MAATAETTRPVVPAAYTKDRGAMADKVAYWFAAGSIYVTFGFLWYYSFKEKLFDQDGKMPPPLKKMFDGSFIDSFPGLDAAWVLLGVLEAFAFVAIVASLVTGEFLPSRRKPILLCGLGLSMLTFGVMLFAQSMIAQFDSVASLFGYFTGSAIVVVLVLLMPPYRPRWLSGLLEH